MTSLLNIQNSGASNCSRWGTCGRALSLALGNVSQLLCRMGCHKAASVHVGYTERVREDCVGVEGRPPAGCVSCIAKSDASSLPDQLFSVQIWRVKCRTHNFTSSFEWFAESCIFKTMPDPAVANPALATLLKSAEAPPFARRTLISVGDWAGKEYRMPSITEHQAKKW